MEPYPRIAGGLAFIFDLDGVIVDSNPVHTATWREHLENCGLALPDDFAQKMFGRRNDDIVRAFFGEGLSEAEIFRHGAEKEALYRKVMGRMLDQCLVPGITEFLERHRAVPMALASNAEPANVEFVLDTGGLRKYFRVVIDGHQVERPKPHPEIYQRAAELLGTAPANCIVFEDTPAGVEAARAAGTRIVAIETTYTGLPDVDLRIRDFLEAELETWLRAQEPLPAS